MTRPPPDLAAAIAHSRDANGIPRLDRVRALLAATPADRETATNPAAAARDEAGTARDKRPEDEP